MAVGWVCRPQVEGLTYCSTNVGTLTYPCPRTETRQQGPGAEDLALGRGSGFNLGSPLTEFLTERWAVGSLPIFSIQSCWVLSPEFSLRVDIRFFFLSFSKILIVPNDYNYISDRQCLRRNVWLRPVVVLSTWWDRKSVRLF